MDPVTRTLTILILLAAFVAVSIGTSWVRRNRAAFRMLPIPGYAAVPALVGAGIEQGRPMLVSISGDSLAGPLTPYTLLSAELAAQIARRAAVSSETPTLAVSEATAVPLMYSTLRRAYRSRKRLEHLRLLRSVQWYGSGTRSLAFAALMTGIQHNERSAAAIFAGDFGPELALPLWAAARARIPTLVATHSLEGQAVGYVLADHALPGDGFSLAGAYLGEESAPLGAAAAANLLRLGAIVALILPLIGVVGNTLTGGALLRALSGLFAGGQ